MLFGATDYQPPSRFLAEIPDHLVEVAGTPSRRGRGSSAHREAVVSAAIRRGDLASTDSSVVSPGTEREGAPGGASGADQPWATHR